VDPEQDFYNWMNGLKGLGQVDENASDNPISTRLEKRRTPSPDLHADSRWQDEGGEGG
jgi:hypothetical protein